MHSVLNFLLMVFMSLEPSATDINCNTLSGTVMISMISSAINDDEEGVEEELEAYIESNPCRTV